MKIKTVSRLLVFLTLLFAANSQEQHHHDEVATRSIDYSELTPTPHVMRHQHGLSILKTDLLPEERLWWESYNTTTYFTVETKHRTSLYMHISMMLISFIFVYPVCLILNNVGSNWYLPLLTVHCGLVTIGLVNYSVFINSIPDLYPNNAYNKMTWILLFLNSLHFFFAIVRYGYEYFRNDKSEYFGISDEETCASPSITLYDLARDSSPNSFELNHDGNANGMNFKTSNNSMFAPTKNPFRALYKIKLVNLVINRLGNFSIYIFNILNWSQFFYFLVYFPTGVATFLLLGKGKAVFNLLAHFIKGGVFFSFGLLSLARYCGAFTNKGWSWNHKFIKNNEVNASRWNRIQSKGLFTMEFIESSLILFYGITNIFLEHLSNADEPYSSKDLQHASIAFIFIGCGLCGVLTETKLNSWRYDKAIQHFDMINSSNSSHKIVKSSPGFSPNPFPILTIYWTGYLMSKHQQASKLSTEIHIEWGNLFILGCAFRFLTYLLLMILSPDKKLTKPSRPITELIVSFSLICGGLIFMESTDPVILCFEYRGFTSMFTLNVSLGLVTLLMGWEMCLFSFKDWLIKRKS